MNNFNTGSHGTELNDFLDEAPNIDDILREFKEESGDLDWVDAYTSFEEEPEPNPTDDESTNLLARLREISEGRNEAQAMPAETAPPPQPTPAPAVAPPPPQPQQKAVEMPASSPPATPTPQPVAVAPNNHIQAGRNMPLNATHTSNYEYDAHNSINFTALINNAAAQTWVNFATELKNLSLEIMTAGATGAMTPDMARNSMSALIDAVGEANKPQPDATQITKTIHELMLMTIGQLPLVGMCSDVNLAACLIPMLK